MARTRQRVIAEAIKNELLKVDGISSVEIRMPGGEWESIGIVKEDRAWMRTLELWKEAEDLWNWLTNSNTLRG